MNPRNAVKADERARRAGTRWTDGNRVQLYENGEEFFPAAFEAIRAARREVIVETFIVFEDKVGWELHAALMEAARQGARVDLMVDGFGSEALTPAFLEPLAQAGVKVRVFDPASRVLGVRLNMLRRMHRKLLVVDGERAFVGGINYSADHLGDFGPQAKQDYAVEINGPLVAEIRAFAMQAMRDRPEREGDLRNERRTPSDPARKPAPQHVGDARALFVTRDNREHHNDIERHYRAAIRSARRRVLIANAYFFPGYLLLREMRRAARRGVDVQLVLQGEPDMPIVRVANLLYDHLMRDGVKIHEYCRRPLHGKVAVVDDDWSTVGSSNLDPLSLSLNLEANVVIRDRAFADELGGKLEALIRADCRQVSPGAPPRWPWWDSLRNAVVFHFLRRFPAWASRLPPHAPRLQTRSRGAA